MGERDEMYERLCEMVSDPDARLLYMRLRAQYMGRYGEIIESVQHILSDIAYQEQVKTAFKADIATRGAVEKVHNGRQQFIRGNKSITEITRLAESQRKLLGELRLTTASGKIEPVEDNDADDGDAFDSF